MYVNTLHKGDDDDDDDDDNNNSLKQIFFAYFTALEGTDLIKNTLSETCNLRCF
jgi:hypothetical protein